MNNKKQNKKDIIDKEYQDFIKKVAEAENYNKTYYQKNRDKMRKYQRKYLKEIRLGIRKPKNRKKKNNNNNDDVMKITKGEFILTFD